MRCRLLRLSQSCDVLPSLGVGAELAPSRADLDTFILRLSLQNLQVLRCIFCKNHVIFTAQLVML